LPAFAPPEEEHLVEIVEIDRQTNLEERFLGQGILQIGIYLVEWLENC